jgi:hypothetical protein
MDSTLVEFYNREYRHVHVHQPWRCMFCEEPVRVNYPVCDDCLTYFPVIKQ